MKLTSEKLLTKYLPKATTHANEVARLSKMLFEVLSANIKEMPLRELEILQAAALLHDIGYSIGAKSHNKHSRDIILKEGIQGFADEEVKIIACIARFHRGSLPDKNRHELYASFQKTDRKIIKRLAGILRLADGLDVEHKTVYEKIELEFDEVNRVLNIILHPIQNCIPDISKAIRKRDLLELGFKCQSVLYLK